ncbi:MAG: UxaA family hydrolase [Acidobacteriaceae bacterium]
MDNVATMLGDVEGGPVTVYGAATPLQVTALEPIVLGHKIALASVDPGEPIVKYGVVIGLATVPIAPGTWVHLHNCRSQVDDRSNQLDPKTGAALDTPYV